MRSLPHLLLFVIAYASPLVATQRQALPPKIETGYDAAKNETTVKLLRLKLGAENGKYQSLHSLVFYKYPGQSKVVPQNLTFELITVVKTRRLKIDLQVLLLVDGQKFSLSSNRWAEKNPVPGKPWIAEHIALRMPYQVFQKLVNSSDVVIQLDTVKFTVGPKELQMLRDFYSYINEA